MSRSTSQTKVLGIQGGETVHPLSGSIAGFALSIACLALCIAPGCATGSGEPSPAMIEVITPPVAMAKRADDRERTDPSETVGESPAVQASTSDEVEEVVVVGNRTRLWLPLVGTNWPDKDCQLRVRRVGAGDRRSIFVADLGRSGRAWRHVARRLADGGHQSTLVTLPGSDGNRPCTWRGAVREQAGRLVADLVREGPGPVSLVGDVFGAQVVLEAATHLAADHVHNFVLYDVVPRPQSLQNPLLKGYAMTPAAAFAAQARVTPPGWWTMWSAIDVRTGREFADKAVQSEILDSLRRSDPVTVSYELIRGLGSGADTLRQRIESNEGPVLALWPTGPAGKERKSRAAAAAQYAELPNIVWRTVGGHGTGAMLEASEAVAGHIRAFWQDTGFLSEDQ